MFELLFPPTQSEKEKEIINESKIFIEKNAYYPNLQPIFPKNVIHAQIIANHNMRNTEHDPGSCKIAKNSGKLVYFIHGKNDCVIDRRLAINGVRYNPNSRLKMIPGCGHFQPVRFLSPPQTKIH